MSQVVLALSEGGRVSFTREGDTIRITHERPGPDGIGMAGHILLTRTQIRYAGFDMAADAAHSLSASGDDVSEIVFSVFGA